MFTKEKVRLVCQFQHRCLEIVDLRFTLQFLDEFLSCVLHSSPTESFCLLIVITTTIRLKRMLSLNASTEIRTQTIQILNLSPLPIGIQRLTAQIGFEPTYPCRLPVFKTGAPPIERLRHKRTQQASNLRPHA